MTYSVHAFTTNVNIAKTVKVRLKNAVKEFQMKKKENHYFLTTSLSLEQFTFFFLEKLSKWILLMNYSLLLQMI